MQKLFVGNLSYRATESEIRSIFEKCGEVASVCLMADAVTGHSRGFAFVRMPRLDDADEAIVRLNGAILRGRRMRVSEASRNILPPTQREDKQRQRLRPLMPAATLNDILTM